MDNMSTEEMEKLIEDFQEGRFFSSKQIELIMKTIDNGIINREEKIKMAERDIEMLYDLKNTLSNELF